MKTFFFKIHIRGDERVHSGYVHANSIEDAESILRSEAGFSFAGESDFVDARGRRYDDPLFDGEDRRAKEPAH